MSTFEITKLKERPFEQQFQKAVNFPIAFLKENQNVLDYCSEFLVLFKMEVETRRPHLRTHCDLLEWNISEARKD